MIEVSATIRETNEIFEIAMTQRLNALVRITHNPITESGHIGERSSVRPMADPPTSQTPRHPSESLSDNTMNQFRIMLAPERANGSEEFVARARRNGQSLN